MNRGMSGDFERYFGLEPHRQYYFARGREFLGLAADRAVRAELDGQVSSCPTAGQAADEVRGSNAILDDQESTRGPWTGLQPAAQELSR